MATEPHFRHGSYARRILLAAAAALAGLFLLAILGPDEDHLQDWLFHTGIEGELRILPDIEIIQDQDPVSQEVKRSHSSATKGLNVKVVDRHEPELHTRDASPISPQRGTPDFTLDTRAEQREGDRRGSENRDQIRMRRPSQRSLDFILVKLVRPRYPRGAHPSLLSTTVTVDVAIYVEIDGRVDDAYITRGEGGKLFEDEVLRAVRQWAYRYVGLEGKAQPFWDQVRWIFKPVSPATDPAGQGLDG